MDARLVIVGGKASKSQVSVRLPAVIGRSREADLTVAHPMVSRKHCELYEVDGLVMIRDLGSLNGTFVEQNQISEAALDPEAEFTVGPLTFRIEYEYLGEITPPQEVGMAAAGTGQPEGELGADGTDFDLGEPAAALSPPSGPAEIDETLPVDEEPAWAPQPGIAPPDGQLPDFAAWGPAEAEPDEQAQGVGGPPSSSSPPDGAESAPPPDAEEEPIAFGGQEDEDHLAETLELARSPTPHDARVEVAGPDPPRQTTDGPDEESGEAAQPEPAADEPSAAFEADDAESLVVDDAEALVVDLEASGQRQASDEMPDSAGAAESGSGPSAEESPSEDEALDNFLKGFE